MFIHSFKFLFFIICFYINIYFFSFLRSLLTKLFLKHLHLLLKHSFLQLQELISTRPKGVSKLSVIIGTNKPFENFQPYFTRDGKHCNRIFKLYSNFIYDKKCKWIILYFKEYNVSGRFCVLFATLKTCGIA